jgi:hypothetical protein
MFCKHVGTLAVVAILAAGCGRQDLDPNADERGIVSDPGPVKADYTNSCTKLCGKKAPSGCWCDAACDGYGDCCPDKKAACNVATTCAQLACSAGTHCEMKGINGGAVPVCIKDSVVGKTCADLGGTCLPLTFPMGSCQPGQIADTSAGLCSPIPGLSSTCCHGAPVQSCATFSCTAGYHCEMKGINGGAVPACIKDPIVGKTCADLGGTCLPLTFPMGQCAADETPDPTAGLCAPLPGQSATCCVPAPSCASFVCSAGYHCELKGINGGSVPVCIKDAP